MAWRRGIDPVRIVLSGVAVNTVLGAYTSFLQLLNSDNLANVLGFEWEPFGTQLGARGNGGHLREHWHRPCLLPYAGLTSCSLVMTWREALASM